MPSATIYRSWGWNPVVSQDFQVVVIQLKIPRFKRLQLCGQEEPPPRPAETSRSPASVGGAPKKRLTRLAWGAGDWGVQLAGRWQTAYKRLSSGSWRCGGRSEKYFYKKVNGGGKVVDCPLMPLLCSQKGRLGFAFVFEHQGIYESM